MLFKPFTACFVFSLVSARATSMSIELIRTVFAEAPSGKEMVASFDLDVAFVAVSCYLFPPAAFSNAASDAVAVNLMVALQRSIAIGAAGQVAVLAGSNVFAYATRSGGGGSSGTAGSSGNQGPTGQTKSPPNPYGKAGGPAHQAKVQEVVQDIQSQGLRPETEVPIKTVSGQKATRYMDVVARDPMTGQIVEVHQVGKTHKSNPKIPVARERAALRDVRHSPETRGAERSFHEY